MIDVYGRRRFQKYSTRIIGEIEIKIYRRVYSVHDDGVSMARGMNMKPANCSGSVGGLRDA